MIEADPVVDEEPPSDEPPAVDEPPSDIGTGLTGGDGTDGFGLTSGSGAGGGTRLGGSGSGSAGSKWGYYNGQLARSIQGALRSHPDLKNLVFPPSRVAVTLDSTGRVIRVKLMDSTGDSRTDSILTRVLTGLQNPPKPSDMPSPIILRITSPRS